MSVSIHMFLSGQIAAARQPANQNSSIQPPGILISTLSFPASSPGAAEPEEARRAAGDAVPGPSSRSPGHRHQSPEVRHVRHYLHQKDQHEVPGVQRSACLLCLKSGQGSVLMKLL